MQADPKAPCDPELEALVNQRPEPERPLFLLRAEQHFRREADLEVLRQLRAYRRKYHLT